MTARRILWLVLLFAAAAMLLRPHAAAPDLRRLYERGAQAQQAPPVIIVPGILGSKLRDRATGEEIWPGSAFSLLLRARPLALDIDPVTLEPRPDQAEAYDLFRNALGTDLYGEILQTLEHSGGYVRGQPGQPADPGIRRYYLFPYDWRQDNVVTARKLDALIEQIRLDYRDPALKVDVVAHSMGGLVLRYYLQYGTADVLDGNELQGDFSGAAKLRTVVLLGTPNLGSVDALQSFLVGHRVGLQRVPTEVLATMPSVYQLLPHPITDWVVDAGGKPLERDLFFAGTWLAYRWSIFDPQVQARVRARFASVAAGEAYLDTLGRYFIKRLERARRFVWALSYNEAMRAPVKLVVFGADCTPTPARVVIEDGGPGQAAMVRLFPDQIRHPVPGVDYARLMLEPGDGSVTKASLLARQSLNPTVARSEDVFFPLAYSLFLCEDHEHLTRNINFQDNLLDVLLSAEQPWAGQQLEGLGSIVPQQSSGNH